MKVTGEVGGRRRGVQPRVWIYQESEGVAGVKSESRPNNNEDWRRVAEYVLRSPM